MINKKYGTNYTEDQFKSKGLGKAGAAKGKAAGAAGGATIGTGAAAGNSVRNVTVNIQNLVKELIVKTETIKESSTEIRKVVQQILIDSVRDYEQAI